MHAAHGCRLRDGPELGVGPATGIGSGRVDREVGQRPPEVVQGEAGARGVALVEHVDRPVDRDVTRVAAQTGDLGVVPDLDVERLRRRTVCSRLEEQRIPLGPELVAHLLGRDRIEGRLDVAHRHRRVEHIDVRAEVGVARCRDRRREGPADRRGRRGRGEEPGERRERRDEHGHVGTTYDVPPERCGHSPTFPRPPERHKSHDRPEPAQTARPDRRTKRRPSPGISASCPARLDSTDTDRRTRGR